MILLLVSVPVNCLHMKLLAEAQRKIEIKIRTAICGRLHILSMENFASQSSGPIQSKLLRVLEEKRFERVGGTQPIDVSVRILTATNKDLRAAVAEKTFREDLYFRISAVPITIPPLRDRGDDVLLLAEHFLEKFKREFRKPLLELTEEARARLALLKAGSRPEDIAEARARRDMAQAQRDQAAATLDYCSVRAPSDGVVLAVPAAPGQFISTAIPAACEACAASSVVGNSAIAT